MMVAGLVSEYERRLALARKLHKDMSKRLDKERQEPLWKAQKVSRAPVDFQERYMEELKKNRKIREKVIKGAV